MMSIFHWKYRYCKVRMIAFVNGDLSLRARRRVARYIDECPECYALYVSERRMANELYNRLQHNPTSPDGARFDRIWSVIQAEINPVTPVSKRPASVNYYHRTRYAVAMMAMVLTMALTLILSNGSVSLVADTTLPEPMNRYTLATTTAPDDNVRVAVATAEANITDAVTNSGLSLTLEATPRPVLEPDEN